MKNEKETKDLIFKFFKKRLQIILRLLQKDFKSYRIESYHILRVEIKKLNACFLILNVDPRTNEILNPIQTIFNKSGKIRALQIVLSHLKDISSKYLDELKSNLKKELFQTKKEFKEIKTKEIGSQKIYKLIKNKLQATSVESIVIKYFDHEKKAIAITQQLSSLNTNKSIHEVRIIIKLLENLNKILPIVNTKIQLLKLAGMNNLLGKWHDEISIEKMILKYIHDYKTSKNQHLFLLQLCHSLNQSANRNLKSCYNIKLHKENSHKNKFTKPIDAFV